MSLDAQRSARLLFAAEIAGGQVQPAALQRRSVRRAVRSRSVPRAPRRIVQRLAMKSGWPVYERACVRPFMRARRAVLGAHAEGPPRLLVRVDEFPHYRGLDAAERYSPQAFGDFHAIMAAAGVPYLLSVLPRLAHRPLDPDAAGGRALDAQERRTLDRLAGDGVTFALHGCDHRTRRSHPRRRSELAGLSLAELDVLLDVGEATLAESAIRPRVFVAPYNRFDAAHWATLARRYAVICGGPETVVQIGFHPAPSWRDEAVYLPAYPPLYGRAADVVGAVDVLSARGVSLWTPIVLHWGVELDEGWEALERLARRIAPWTRSWDEFLDAVEASR